MTAAEGKAAPAPPAEKKAELFYTVGSPELVEARKVMAAFSFQVRPFWGRSNTYMYGCAYMCVWLGG